MYDYGYNYGYGYDSYDSAASAVGILAGVGIIMWIIGMAVSVISIIAMWKLYKKAGKPGWASIVPVYNIIVMLEIAELPMWYIALFFVPFANIYAIFKIYIEIAHKFGKSTGFGVGMVFLNFVFIPMLAFGKSQYKGVVSSSNNTSINEGLNMQNNNMQFNQSMMNVNASNMEPQTNNMNFNGNMDNYSMMNNINMTNNSFQPVGNVTNNIDDNNNMINTVSGNMGTPINNNVMDNVNTNVFNSMNATPIASVEPSVSNVQNINVMPSNDVVESLNSFNEIPMVEPAVNSMNNTNMQKTCPNCGSQVNFNAIFCTNCGHNL